MNHHARLYITLDQNSVVNAIEAEESSAAEIVPVTVETLSIDDVRRIIQLAYQTPGAKSYRLVLIAARQIAIEAQHALLKILEEPPSTTRFVLVLPSVAGLLPTVLSRVVLTDAGVAGEMSVLFQEFLRHDAKNRIELIADIAKRKADWDYTVLYDGLVAYVAIGGVAKDHLGVVHTTLLQLRQKGASKKMLWEELALTLPVCNE